MKQVSVSPSFDKSATNSNAAYFRFAEPFRDEIFRFVIESKIHGDLLESFPAMAFALATGYGGHENRVQAYRHLRNGGNLKTAASILDLPWWLRKLPPESFSRPLNILPNGTNFTRRISNLIPKKQRDISNWFRSVLRASEISHDDFVIWIAGRKELWMEPDILNLPLELLATWAWYGQHPETRGYELLKKRWHPKIGLHTALEEAKTWYNRVKLIVQLEDLGLEDSWLRGDTVMGYDFRPLRTANDFLNESEAMDNCLDQYADHIRYDDVRVFSIWKNGQRIANIEIGSHEDDSSIPTIEQLRGAGNHRVPACLWQAAYAWIGGQSFEPRFPNRNNRLAKNQNSESHPIWYPYMQFADSKLSQYKTGVSVELPITDIAHSDALLVQLETILSYIETGDDGGETCKRD